MSYCVTTTTTKYPPNQNQQQSPHNKNNKNRIEEGIYFPKFFLRPKLGCRCQALLATEQGRLSTRKQHPFWQASLSEATLLCSGRYVLLLCPSHCHLGLYNSIQSNIINKTNAVKFSDDSSLFTLFTFLVRGCLPITIPVTMGPPSIPTGLFHPVNRLHSPCTKL